MSKSRGFRYVYRRFAEKHFILIQSLRSGVLISAGDLIAQTCIEKKSPNAVDFRRTARVFTVGAVVVGPNMSVWYSLLSKTFGPTGRASALKKMATDQLLFAPYIQAVILAAINTLNGHNWDFTKEQFSLKYTDILLTSYKVWPAVLLVNFTFVPPAHQVLVTQCVSLFWNTFLCWKTHQGVDDKLVL